ncbi:hypothetical protein E4U57_001593 [Claviceps arundinis]|uniref:Uncharacterized protein n=1 Tax=Claviceps arundinis TaxID=1623583 RepID=A0A9P7MQW7_9HYPO|nr:hypothetical protein E4U56_002382 [Claviceps arundinis]KAG5966890.1 hypothetical protein E4U57_001593 [Claviceps arundinis]
MELTQDSIQPEKVILEQYYELGYRLWHGLYLAALSSPLDATALDFQHAFPSHPYLVPKLRLDTRCDGTLYATGTSTWKTSTGDCSLPSFEKKYKIPVTAGDSVIVSLQLYHGRFGQDGGHISLLMLAWAYVLSQRWSELIPGAEAIKYTNSSAALSDGGGGFEQTDGLAVDLGVVTDEAVRWWAAILAPEEGWTARIHHRGEDLRSPWSVSLQSSKTLMLTFRAAPFREGRNSPPSFSTAAQYIAAYANYHGIEDQNRAAFAAALLLPTRRRISNTFRWPCPAWQDNPRDLCAEQFGPPWGEDRKQLDRLITLSCNTSGMLSLLTSSFIDPDLPCNVSGVWMQGAFAVLDEPEAQRPDILRSMLLKRSPNLGFLWLGAIFLDMQGFIMTWARPVAYTVDLHSAAWTFTLGTFLQRPVANYPRDAATIQRVDEARLMFLSQDESHSEPPVIPFPPFGTIAVKDCVLEVQLHASCSGSHRLLYAGWAWDCLGGVRVAQDSGSRLLEFSEANEHPAASLAIRYDKLDDRRNISIYMTRNIFIWLREIDGWPISERGIHESLDDDWTSEDESAAPEGDGKSTTSRRHVSPWLSRALTKRSRTI